MIKNVIVISNNYKSEFILHSRWIKGNKEILNFIDAKLLEKAYSRC